MQISALASSEGLDKYLEAKGVSGGFAKGVSRGLGCMMHHLSPLPMHHDWSLFCIPASIKTHSVHREEKNQPKAAVPFSGGSF